MVVVDFGVDVARTNGIHIDAKTPPLHGQHFGHLHHRGFAHAIRANLRQHTQARHRGDVDDAPPRVSAWCCTFGPRQHAFAHFLRHEE